MRIVFLLTLLAANLMRAQTAPEKAVIDAVQKLFNAMEAKDAATIRTAMLPGAQLVSIRPDGKATVTLVEKFAETIGAAKDSLVEKMWDPKVLLEGKIATLWAPYDFHRGGKFTHCGIDAVSLLKVDGEWKIASITYTVIQEGCVSK